MRTVLLALVVAMLALTPSAASVSVHASAPASVATLRLASGDVLVAWTPVEGADAYVVLRGETPDLLEVVAVTAEPFHLDAAAPAGATLHYVVEAKVGDVDAPRANGGPPPEPQKCGVVYHGSGAQVYASGCTQGGPT